MLTLWYWSNKPHMDVEREVAKLGKVQEVIEHFERPANTIYDENEDYYIQNWSYEKRNISNQVMVFYPSAPEWPGTDIILYVYLDTNNGVENYFVGAS